MRVIRSNVTFIEKGNKIIAKLNGKTVGFIEKNRNGGYTYAFGSPSQSSYVGFDVDDLETAKSRIEGNVFVGSSRRPVKSGWVFVSSIGDASIFEENDKYLVTLEKGANIVEEYFDDEATARDFAKEIASAFTKSSCRPVKSGYEGDDAEAEELALYIKNTSELYHGITKSVIENLKKKARKGLYDKERAVDAWMYAADAGAKMYDKEFGSGRGSLTMFSKSSRRKAAEELARYYEENVLEGLDNVQSAFRPVKSAKTYKVLDQNGGVIGVDKTYEDAKDLAEDINGIFVPTDYSDEQCEFMMKTHHGNQRRKAHKPVGNPRETLKSSYDVDSYTQSAFKIVSGKHTVEYSKPSREELEKVLDDFLAQKKVKFATDIYDDTVDYILTFWDEQDFKPRSVEEAVTDWYNDTKKHFPEDLKKISAAYHRWIKSKLNIIKSSKFYTNAGRWKYNTAVAVPSRNLVMSFFEEGSWTWDDMTAIVGELDNGRTEKPAVIFGSKGEYPKIEKGTGLFNDQSWNDIGYFSFRYYSDNTDVFDIPGARYFVLK